MNRDDIAGAPARILIVDDEPRDRQLVEIMLTSQGYHLQAASSGPEALAMIRADPPDLILLDVLMPGSDGYEVARAIKDDAASRNIPLILVTALDDREARLHGLESGAEDFLSKPLDGAELCARVRNLLRLKTAYEELTRRNAEIAAALSVARDARRDAEDANAAKTHLLRVMSHELRTPLNAITGYAQLLELGVRGAINREQGHDVGRIRRAASYLTRLIGDILTAEKLELPRPLDLERTTMFPVLEAVEDLCSLQARTNGLQLTFIQPDDDVFVLADVERVKQILINLVTNALKFTPKGGSVRVTCSRNARLLQVSVADTGVGISPRDIERVFDPFVQVDRQQTHVADQGVGLGLSISRELARAMGGDLTLQSSEGVGSTFTLILPEAASDAALDIARPSSRATSGSYVMHLRRSG